MNVYKKLQIARLLLQDKPLKKSGKNKFANYEYFELQDFLPTVQAIFGDTGLSAVFRCGSDMASLTIYDVENPESNIVFTAPMAAAELKGCHPVQPGNQPAQRRDPQQVGGRPAHLENGNSQSTLRICYPVA